MMDFENHMMLTLRCLCKNITAVSLKLTNTVKHPKVLTSLKTEKQLLFEWLRTINNHSCRCTDYERVLRYDREGMEVQTLAHTRMT